MWSACSHAAALSWTFFCNLTVQAHRVHAKQSGSMAAHTPHFSTRVFSNCCSNLAEQDRDTPITDGGKPG